MIRYLILMGLLFFSRVVTAQQRLVVAVRSGGAGEPLPATVQVVETGQSFAADTAGRVVVPFEKNGRFQLRLSAAGHQALSYRITIPHSADTLSLELEADEEELEEVVIQTTRTSRTITNVPTRVETVTEEEIDEKSNMRPGHVAMLLNESTGIQVQQTSATSGNASIRIQGLDGRYTQLLKDGFPSFGNFSSGLGVLEIPPLDLQQVEIIKGPASPLFGGGAIAGVVNFISKTPRTTPQYNFILNGSHIGQYNLGGFAAQRGRKLGYTLLAQYNGQKPYDVDEDHFTEVPRLRSFTVHPKLFFYPSENTTLQVGNHFTFGNRTGGDVLAIDGTGSAEHPYFEQNKTVRNTATLEWDHRQGSNRRWLARQSFSFFDRSIRIPEYRFSGVEHHAFTDVSYIVHARKHALVAGGSFQYNRFREKENRGQNLTNRSQTGGLYAQHTLDATDRVKLESGLRVEGVHYSNQNYGNTEWFVLPRVSLLVRFHPQWTSRISGGMGYKMPTLFTEETETLQYRNLLQLRDVRSERSWGGTADVNFRAEIGADLSFTANHMFFYTRINHPLVLQAGSGQYHFVNATQPVQSAGFETNLRWVYRDHLKLFVGYTNTTARAAYDNDRLLPRVPRHKWNSALIYEKEDVVKLGLEGYFTGRQYLSNGTETPAFSVFGFMAEKIFEGWSVFLNFENFTDTRQLRYKNVVNGLHTYPAFDEIWTHTEGFVVNGGIKVKL